MAMLDSGNRSRDALPSISHLDLDKINCEAGEKSRFPIMSSLSISTAPMGSPTTVYSGPPPPYSCASSTLGPTHTLSGYISPPESTTRRSTRDERESPSSLKILPSIHEALGEKTMMPTPLSTAQSYPPGSTPATAIGQSFPDAPRGPVNPFSQPSAPASTPKETPLSQPLATSHNQPEQVPRPSGLQASLVNDTNPPAPQPYPYPVSPRASFSSAHRNPTVQYPSITNQQHETHSLKSPHQQADHVRRGYQFSEYPTQTAVGRPPTVNSFQFEPNGKFDDSRNPFARTSIQAPYGDTVKRHLDIYDAELAVNEIHEASTRTLDFSRFWVQKYQQNNRSSYMSDGLPTIHDVDDMLRNSQHIMESLTRLRDVVFTHQTALSEERARAARTNHLSEDYHNLPDEFKMGGFAGGDAKKRRGKAAPPGRCHSCNRAETPEWRRGPDGARTLCNACGLHYAKLTRKIGANKAGNLTGSNLRPKTLDHRS